MTGANRDLMAPTPSLWCEVLDTRTGERHRLPVRNEVGSWPQHLGSGPDDAIRLPQGMVPARAVSLLPSGRHIQVTALVPDLVRIRGEVLGRDEARRVDGPFEVGPLRIALRSDGDDEAE